MRQCNKCGRDFNPSSAHKACPSCRSKAGRKTCKCGQPMAKEAKNCRACTPKTGTDNGNYKGLKTKHYKGYIMRRLPDHPRASTSGAYVFEHIVVMEDFLGRLLLPGENVHHINGQKDDNRIENLELWCKPQPAGIRAEDAYRYALEIVERYGDLYGVGIR